MEIVQSARGGNLVSLEGFLFCKDKVYKNGTFAYRCVVKTCKARGLLSKDMTEFDGQNIHDHLPDFTKIEVLKRKHEA